jgi:hypothetical protein
MTAGITLCGFFIPILRNAEKLMPDHDTVPPAPAVDERIGQLQGLLELRQRLLAHPRSYERELALKAVANDLRRLGQS